MNNVTAVLKSRVGNHRVAFYNEDGKETVFLWNEKNNFTCEVPTRVSYTNKWDKEVVLYENFAQHLLDKVLDWNKSSETFGEPCFELVEQKEAPVVTQKIIVVDKGKKPKEESAVVDKSKNKEKKDEKTQ